MRSIITAFLILCGLFAGAQGILVPVHATTYGKHENRIKADSAVMFPQKTPALRSNDSTAQMFYNTNDSSFWGWSRERGFFKLVDVDSILAGIQPAPSVLTTLGDLLSHTTVDVRVSGNTTTVKKTLIQQGNGTISEVAHWDTAQLTEVTNLTPDNNSAYFDSAGVLRNRATVAGSCTDYNTIGLSYISGLTYAYNSGIYSINCQAYQILVSGTLTFANGTAGSNEFRTDAVYEDATGIHIRQGANSVAGVGALPEVDPATERLVAYVRIDETNTTPTGPTSTNVYINNLGGEFAHTTFGTITVVFNFTTITHSADSAIRVTAAGNNGGFRFKNGSVLSSNDYEKLTFWIYNQTAFNANRNWVVRKITNTNTQVTGSAAITLTNVRGYVKATVGSWQLISIPFSAFGGSDPFYGFEIRNTGTTGTPTVLFDDIKFEAGVGSPATQFAFTSIGVDDGTTVDALSPTSRVNILGADGLTVTKSANNITIHGAGSSVNIYNTDGTLTGDRTVNGDNHSLTFSEASGYTFVTNSSQPNLSLLQMSSTGVGLTSENVAGDSLSSISAGFNGTGLSSMTTLVQGYGSNNILVYLDSTVLVGPGVLNLYLEGLPDGSGYDKSLAYNSTTGQVGYTTGGGGGSTLFGLSGDNTATGDVRGILANHDFKIQSSTGSAFDQIRMEGGGGAIDLTSYDGADLTSFWQITPGLTAVNATNATHTHRLLVQADSIYMDESRADQLNFILKGLPDGSAFDKVLAWNSTTHQVGWANPGGGGGSSGPDGFNGTATADVASDFGGFNWNVSNVKAIRYQATDGTAVSQFRLNGNVGSVRASLYADNGSTYRGELNIDEDSGIPYWRFYNGTDEGKVFMQTYGLEYAADYSANYTNNTLIARKDAPAIETGTGAPGSTPVKVGDIYVDTSAKKLYFATGTSSSADWTIAN